MPAAQLLPILEQERAHVSAFLSLLHVEAPLIGGAEDLVALGEVTDKKQALARVLTEVGARRDTWLKANGFAPGFQGMQAACAAHPELGPVWHELTTQAQSASEQNAQNGALIDAHLLDTTQSISALRNLQGGGAPIYDALGRTRSGGNRRAIAAG